jgi:DNA-binding transcriptional LysR family regulator
MNWEYLRSLIAVARGGTLSAAGKIRGTKHSTISRHLADLESHLQTKLVERSPAGLTLTEAGQKLLQSAEAMEAQAERAQEEIGGLNVSVSGTIRIGAPDAFGAFFLAPTLAGLMKQQPRLTIQLVATPRAFNLTKHEADIAIALTLPERGRLIARKMMNYGLGIYGSESYLAEAPPINEQSDLKNHSFIDYIGDLIYTSQLDYLDEIAKGANASFQSSNIIAQLQAALGGMGLCILPYFLARPYPQLKQILPDTVRLTRSWFILMHEEQKDLARVRITVDYIVSQAVRNTDLFLQP